MAAKRGKSQARRNTGGKAGLPGWAWLALGVVLTVVVVFAAPKFFRGSGGDGSSRPKPNPDAQPAAPVADDAIVPDDDADADEAKPAADKPKYDFYTLLPADEVAMSDAEVAAIARDEAARRAREGAAATDAADAADAASAGDDGDAAELAAAERSMQPAPGTAAGAASPAAGDDLSSETPYLLQAGAFGASGDAEAVKAKIALLGLGARVESAEIQGKTVYRVRMGPYGTASELAEAKRKLAAGGLPAMAIKAR